MISDKKLEVVARNIHRYHIDADAPGAVTVLFDHTKAPLAFTLAAVLRESSNDVTMVDVTHLGTSEAGVAVNDSLDNPNRYCVVLCSTEMWQKAGVSARFTPLPRLIR